MRYLTPALFSLCILALGGCANAVKLQNVAGTWSCPREDGVCLKITSIDEGIVGPRDSFTPVGGDDDRTLSTGVIPVAVQSNPVMPSRTADEVARIVLAPSVDHSGRYHGSRVLFAVMKPGSWIEHSYDDGPSLISAERPPATRLTPERSETSSSETTDLVEMSTEIARLEAPSLAPSPPRSDTEGDLDAH